MLFPRGLDEAAVAAVISAPGAYRSIGARGIVRPDHHLAAVAVIGRVGLDHRIRAQIGGPGILDLRIFALIIAAQQGRAAPCGTGDIYAGLAQ